MLISRISILHIIINWSFPHPQKQLRLGYNFEFYRVKPKLIHRSYSWSKGRRFRSRIQGGCPQPLPLSFYSSQPEPKSCSEPRFLKIWKHNIKNKVCQNPDAPYFFSSIHFTLPEFLHHLVGGVSQKQVTFCDQNIYYCSFLFPKATRYQLEPFSKETRRILFYSEITKWRQVWNYAIIMLLIFLIQSEASAYCCFSILSIFLLQFYT